MKTVKQGSKELILNDQGIVLKVRTINNEPTKADQTQKEQCDIKNIMKKYNNNINNVIPPSRGVYADVSEVPSYQTSLHVLRDAQNSFDSLPAVVRKRFSNDPEEMLKFLADKDNNEEAIKLGLKNKPTPPQPKQTTNDDLLNAINANNKTSKQKQNTKTDSDD